jgi:hypothetical protein
MKETLDFFPRSERFARSQSSAIHKSLRGSGDLFLPEDLARRTELCVFLAFVKSYAHQSDIRYAPFTHTLHPGASDACELSMIDSCNRQLMIRRSGMRRRAALTI